MKKIVIFLGLVVGFIINDFFDGRHYYSAEEINSEVSASIIDENTGETKELIVSEKQDLSNYTRFNSSTIKTSVVFAPIEIEENNSFARTSSGGNKTSGGVVARINVTYDITSKRDKIKVNKINGSWTPTSNTYNISNRQAGFHSGFVAEAKQMTKYPTSNSFNYSTESGDTELVTIE